MKFEIIHTLKGRNLKRRKGRNRNIRHEHKSKTILTGVVPISIENICDRVQEGNFKCEFSIDCIEGNNFVANRKNSISDWNCTAEISDTDVHKCLLEWMEFINR